MVGPWNRERLKQREEKWVYLYVSDQRIQWLKSDYKLFWLQN